MSISIKYRNRLRIKKHDEIVFKKERLCDNPKIVKKNGDLVCTNCGIVIGKDIVDNERRAFTAEEIGKIRRTEPRWREFGPRTILPNDKVDSNGNRMGAKEKTLFARLSKIQRSFITSIERNYGEAKPKLKMIALKLNIPKYIEETAWKIYCEVAKRKLTMGRSMDGLIGACLYAAIRIHEFPKLLEEVNDCSMASLHIIIRSLGLIIKEILPILNLKYHPITAEQLIIRFGNELYLPIKTQKKALKLLELSTKGGLDRNGKDPKGFAASVLYLAAKDSNCQKTQAEISEITGITTVTLRCRLIDISKNL